MDILARYLRIGSYILIFISCINMRLKKKDFFWMVTILMVTLLYGVKTGDLYWSVLILLIYNSKKVDIERVYKTSSRIIAIGVISVLALCMFGVLPDILTSRNTVEHINYNRHSFGFYHSNVLPLSIFYLEVYYICIVKEKIRNNVIVLFVLLAGATNTFCHSRNALILSLALSLFVVFAKQMKKDKHKILYRTTVLSIPCMSIFSFRLPCAGEIPKLSNRRLFPMRRGVLLLFLRKRERKNLPFFSVFPNGRSRKHYACLLMVNGRT